MMRTAWSIFLALVLAASTAFGQLTINTPTHLPQCVAVLLSWTGGAGPYYLNVIEPGSLAILLQLGTVEGLQYTWIPTLPVGTSVAFTVSDSTGIQGATAPVTVLAGMSTSCLGSSSSSSSSSATDTTSTSATTSSATGTVAATAPPSTTTGAAVRPKAPALGGLVALVMAAAAIL